MSEETDELLEQYEEKGYVLLPDLLDEQELARVRAALAPYLTHGLAGRNDFEGVETQRVYSLVGRGEAFERMVEHQRVLALVDALLAPDYLLTASQAICIHPGETPQPVHYDDTFYPLSRPRLAISVSTMWAIDDFTAQNGATEMIAGSHLWSDLEVRDCYGADGPSLDAEVSREVRALLRPVEMSAGSCMVFAGTLLHRGGTNRSTESRRAISHQYCEPWARQQEAFLLSIPKTRVRSMSPRLQAMLGYSILPPFMGQVAGRHPIKTLEPGYRNSLEQDAADAGTDPV